ncbi:MAG: coproporphyrinogen dehydrogenase HemZ [Ruminococcaceae bacterium]|nr:coproporphyrinogen dehydrogenase HemZ [Oscillospiraceae bacterium]
MILNVKGDLNAYYAQMLCMIFFPGAKFPEGEAVTEDTVCVDADITESDGVIRAHVAISRGEKKERGTASLLADGERDPDKAKKLALGRAFLEAGERFTGFTPPWGILTGVRPAKVVSEMLAEGLTRDECIRRLTEEYMVTPVKAEIAADVALAENRLITDESRRCCSVYIAIPFCPTRCAYCSFVSYTSPKLLKLIPDYLKALAVDIKNTFEVIRRLGLSVSTIYIGGGTPTILNESELEFLLDALAPYTEGIAEYTLESGRPDTITREKLQLAARYGVDRISVNPQTLDDEVLRKIGRAHTTDMFYRAYETARDVGIKAINVDTIAGLPYDTSANFARTIDRIIDLEPENVTVHTFTVKKSAEILKDGVFDRDGQDAALSVRYSEEALTEAGYYPYYMYRQKNTVGNLENVGYAKNGFDGLYNVYMMEEVHSIFACGASSVTKFVSLPGDGDIKIERIFEPKYPYEYLDDHSGETGEARRRALLEKALAFYTENKML